MNVWMIASLIIATVQPAGFNSIHVPQTKLEVRLIDTPPVTKMGATVQLSAPSSIGGVIVQTSVGVDSDRNGLAATLIYGVPEKATAFRALFGVPDHPNTANAEAILTVFLDGEVYKEYRAQGTVKPVRVDIPMTGKNSLKFVFEGPGAIGNPMFSNVAIGAPVIPPKPQTGTTQGQPPIGTVSVVGDLPRVNLTAPENGATFRDQATIKWSKVDGAVSYGLEIILVANSTNKVPTRFIRAFTVQGTEFEWNFSDDVVSGDYQASVIAFGKKGIISRFSLSRKFKVVRRS